ncbi:MAG: hypothetical protein VKI42_04390 [Synechococcaceae cyanobacterium]|nr:hypothetical protein [Synechococcaceae cyanobacterium]
MSPDPTSPHVTPDPGPRAALGCSVVGHPNPGGSDHRFNIGDALHDGMTAFRRAPLSFSLFSAGLTALQVVLLPLQERLLVEPGRSLQPIDAVLFLLGFSLSLAVSLWGSQGMVRGAWAALGGQRPSLMSLLRWDGPGFIRLIRAWALLGLLLLIPLLALLAALVIALLLLAAPAGVSHQPALMLLASVLVGAGGLTALGSFGLLLTYLSVNQQFLAQIALLEGSNGIATLKRGRRLVDHQWLLLLLLLLIKGLLLVLGGLLAFITLGIGWILAWPLVSCITTAAYRQLRQREPGEADAGVRRVSPAG